MSDGREDDPCVVQVTAECRVTAWVQLNLYGHPRLVNRRGVATVFPDYGEAYQTMLLVGHLNPVAVRLRQTEKGGA